MRKMLVVAVREYLAAVRTKAFVISLIVMPILMGGSAFMQWLLRDIRDTTPKTFAVVDRTPGEQLRKEIEEIAAQHNDPPFKIERVTPSEARDEQRAELSERVRKGDYFGFLDIGAHVLEPASAETESEESHCIRYQSNHPTNRAFTQLMETKLVPKVQEIRFARERMHGSLQQVRAVMQPVKIESKGLTRRNDRGEIEDATPQTLLAPVLVPLGLLILMFMVIMMSATPLMQGVVEEKMQRIAEVLLASVRPFDLMLGKLLGMSAVSLTITTVYLGGLYWAAHHYGFHDYVSPAVLAWFLVFQALAALMYGSLFIAIGAACTDMKETQNLLWPVMLLACLPMFVLGNVLQEPNSAVATSLSFFPFATPMLMILRLSIPPGVAVWQPLLGVVLVLATTLLCVWAAGRIFRVGILMQGKGAKLGEMLHWVFRG
ncbi:MAG TPA: ABC transporter permease [Gemmataceae bacterium]|jgi:ABC-2 type transport system permease protein